MDLAKGEIWQSSSVDELFFFFHLRWLIALRFLQRKKERETRRKGKNNQNNNIELLPDEDDDILMLEGGEIERDPENSLPVPHVYI
jgi:hypothetical protein